ncbi:MAG TPA: DNA alkylation repair protein [Croceibacterium sp.]|nr:DNA alkylation repair protein [Croceibacterium sp.]
MSALRDQVRERLRAEADPAKALAMQAYMKSAMPYRGVQTTPLRAICKDCFAGLTWDDGERWQRAVRELWRGATHREERYAAIELARHRSGRPFHTLAAQPLYREMIESGAWWDMVDSIAPSLVFELLQAEPAAMGLVLRDWAHDDDMWVRRAAIIAQLAAKRKTDLALLYDCIEPSISSKEFFLRKAIGWALRQYARTDPREVSRYVAVNAEHLSPLSRREALKHIAQPG